MKRDFSPAVELIKRFEGCSLVPYLCPAGHWTIGYGRAIGGKSAHGKITKDQAEQWLSEDVRRVAAGVEQAVKVPINNNQFCALVSFAYNVGLGALARSTLLRLLNEGHPGQVPVQLIRWTKAGGKELTGLRRRREAEAALWG